MFKKVLVAEDIDSINLSVVQVLKGLGITGIAHVKYCDDALIKVKRAIADNNPFDLFICDLSFEPDHRDVKIRSGEEAIRQVRELQPNLKILVYSIEGKSFRVKSLFEKCSINGYVLKGRDSMDYLRAAIKQIDTQNEAYVSPTLQHIFRDKTTREIDDYDIKIIQQLAIGISQDEMEARFKELGITPNSKSTIEKRISKLKDYFRASNTIHLIAIAKDLGIA